MTQTEQTEAIKQASRDALEIQDGACNPRAIARALVKAIDASCDQGGSAIVGAGIGRGGIRTVRPFDLIADKADWLKFAYALNGPVCFIKTMSGALWRTEYDPFNGVSFAKRWKPE